MNKPTLTSIILAAGLATGTAMQSSATSNTSPVFELQQGKNSTVAIDNLINRIRVNGRLIRTVVQKEGNRVGEIVLQYVASGYNEKLKSKVTFIYTHTAGNTTTLRTIIFDDPLYTNKASIMPEGKKGIAYLTFIETEGAKIDGQPESIGLYMVLNNESIINGVDIGLTRIDQLKEPSEERLKKYKFALETPNIRAE